MSDFSTVDVDQIVAACNENLGDIANSFNSCFDLSFRIEVGKPVSWNPDSLPEGFKGPGIATAFEVGEQGMIGLVSESLPLPDWYTEPNDSQSARLQTLAMEWSMQMLPIDLEATRFTTIAIEDLAAEVIAARPVDEAHFLELLIFAEGSDDSAKEEPEQSADDEAETKEDAEAAASEGEAETESSESGESSGEPIGRIYIVWPIANPPFPIVAEESPEEPTAEPAQPQAPTPVASAPAHGIERVRGLPVSISVRLAEKKIEVTQLIGLSQGALITFNKPCEDLLDLYVNNRLCFRGEAVKIGEKFGLKINEVDVQVVREEKIINS